MLDDVIAKLHEMEGELAMARLEAAEQSLLASRIRHLAMLAIYVRAKLQSERESADLPLKAGDQTSRNSPA